MHHCTVNQYGVISVGRYHVGVGCQHRGAYLTAIRDHDRATVYNLDGQPIGHAYLDPAKSYTPLTHTTAV